MRAIKLINAVSPTAPVANVVAFAVVLNHKLMAVAIGHVNIAVGGNGRFGRFIFISRSV
jgi:hypothetical protein